MAGASRSMSIFSLNLGQSSAGKMESSRPLLFSLHPCKFTILLLLLNDDSIHVMWSSTSRVGVRLIMLPHGWEEEEELPSDEPHLPLCPSYYPYIVFIFRPIDLAMNVCFVWYVILIRIHFMSMWFISKWLWRYCMPCVSSFIPWISFQQMVNLISAEALSLESRHFVDSLVGDESDP